MSPLTQGIITVGSVLIALVGGAFAYRSRRVDSKDKFEAWVRERFQAMFDAQMRDRDARITHLEDQVRKLETALSAKDVALKQCAGECDRLRRERDDCLTKSKALYREYAALKQKAGGRDPRLVDTSEIEKDD